MGKLTANQVKILKTLDVDAALKYVVQKRGWFPGNRVSALAGLHKARIMNTRYFSEDAIERSKQWLKDNGYEVPMEER